jgi:hypothetical protein
VIAAAERAFAVVTIAIQCDRVELVTASVGASNLERLTDDRLAENLFESLGVLFVEIQLLDPIRRDTSSC